MSIFSIIFSIRLIRGWTYTRAYTVYKIFSLKMYQRLCSVEKIEVKY